MFSCYGESSRKSKCVPLNNNAKKVCFNEKVDICATPSNSKEFTMANFPEHMFHIGELIFISVNTFQKQTRVHIRVYATDDRSILHSTKKGVSLKPKVWSALHERVLLYGENLDQLRDSYEPLFKCEKNQLLTYTLSEYVMAQLDSLPEIDSFYYDVDTPHSLHKLFKSLSTHSARSSYLQPIRKFQAAVYNSTLRSHDPEVKHQKQSPERSQKRCQEGQVLIHFGAEREFPKDKRYQEEQFPIHLGAERGHRKTSAGRKDKSLSTPEPCRSKEAKRGCNNKQGEPIQTIEGTLRKGVNDSRFCLIRGAEIRLRTI
ncbi:PC4 domain-containing protein [Trichonephila clavata]|uniref:PC4 domain-containing protein n=1 Tax=Trichonephila clavata TaxID=2740835 RepID=A0A8X6HJ25_TRICU|nr:PC4 domain-containing protein [Trichonephila clavata]